MPGHQGAIYHSLLFAMLDKAATTAAGEDLDFKTERMTDD